MAVWIYYTNDNQLGRCNSEILPHLAEQLHYTAAGVRADKDSRSTIQYVIATAKRSMSWMLLSICKIWLAWRSIQLETVYSFLTRRSAASVLDVVTAHERLFSLASCGAGSGVKAVRLRSL